VVSVGMVPANWTTARDSGRDFRVSHDLSCRKTLYVLKAFGAVVW
jgi:hypothetical protein